MPRQPRHCSRPTGRARRRAVLGSTRTVLTALLASGALTAATVGVAAVSLTSGSGELTALPGGAVATTSSSPASLSSPATQGQGARVDVRVSPVADVRADLASVPLPAMAAYQRAAAVIDRADKSCHLDWPLLAGVGQVVSQHGLVDGGRMTRHGVVEPALVGNVVHNDAGRRLTDTDAGRLDGDRRHDRAVGPMLLAPSTWNVVGVDADNDGKRNPQDIDDAALGVSVLLCSGHLDLRKDEQAGKAVSRINDDRRFVRAVLAAAADYAQQAKATPVTVIPGPTTIPTDLPTHLVPARQVAPSATPSDPVSPATPGGTETDIPNGPGSPHPTHPTATDTPDPTDSPTDDPTCPADDPSGTPTDEPTVGPTDEPTDPCATAPADEPTDPSESPTP